MPRLNDPATQLERQDLNPDPADSISAHMCSVQCHSNIEGHMPQADPLDLLPKECKVRLCYQLLFFNETMVGLFGQGRW